MKNILLILAIATFIGVSTGFAQSVENQVSSIRSEVTKINNSAKNYKKTTKSVEGISLEGTEVSYFTLGNELKKITAKSYGETFNAVSEIYYRGDELIFVYQQINRYNESIGSKNLKVTKVEEKRFYFADGNMIKLLLGKVNVESGSQEWIDSESEIVDLAKTLKDAY